MFNIAIGCRDSNTRWKYTTCVGYTSEPSVSEACPRFKEGPQANLPDNWPGGFLCPCHGSTYDLAGRVFKDKPAPQNLDVPRYMFASPASVLIGQDEHGEA